MWQENDDYTNTHIQVEVRTVNVGWGRRKTSICVHPIFDEEKFPVIQFKNTDTEMLGIDKGKIYGSPTFHRITREVGFDVELNGKKKSPVSGRNTTGLRLQGVIRCSDFQLAPKYMPTMILDNRLLWTVSLHANRKKHGISSKGCLRHAYNIFKYSYISQVGPISYGSKDSY